MVRKVEKLVPKPHLIKSIRARSWSLPGAIEELIDNSLGHGKATEVHVTVGVNDIMVTDNGIGMDDINRAFRLGDSSSYNDLRNPGQFGVGLTHAAIWLGDILTTRTTRKGIHHSMSLNWADVDRAGEWPDAYTGSGTKSSAIGTQIIIEELVHSYQSSTSEKMVTDFGQIFAPAIRKGAKMMIHHEFNNGDRKSWEVEPYTPHDLGRQVRITGHIDTKRYGSLRWYGRAGLAPSLKERYNGVHISFGHRVIECTRDPFMGVHAPTVYVEVELDDSVPWKYQLADHKDRVVVHRDELMESINASIKGLLQDAAYQAQSLALDALKAPIEMALQRAIKGAGAAFYDPDEEAIMEEGPPDGPGPGPGPGPDPSHQRQTRTLQQSGMEGKHIDRPTGVKIHWEDRAKMENQAFSVKPSGDVLLIILDKEMFEGVITWPIKQRDIHTVHMVIAFLSQAIDHDYFSGKKELQRTIVPALRNQIEKWASEHQKIAPYVYSALLKSAR